MCKFSFFKSAHPVSFSSAPSRSLHSLAPHFFLPSPLFLILLPSSFILHPSFLSPTLSKKPHKRIPHFHQWSNFHPSNSSFTSPSEYSHIYRCETIHSCPSFSFSFRPFSLFWTTFPLSALRNLSTKIHVTFYFSIRFKINPPVFLLQNGKLFRFRIKKSFPFWITFSFAKLWNLYITSNNFSNFFL